jgi:hypothetical protein
VGLNSIINILQILTINIFHRLHEYCIGCPIKKMKQKNDSIFVIWFKIVLFYYEIAIPKDLVGISTNRNVSFSLILHVNNSKGVYRPAI